MHLLLLILAVSALVTIIASAASGKVPLWVGACLLAFIACLQHLPR